ncbi:hypothetical protein ACJX0J_017467, partial [Zea mays]
GGSISFGKGGNIDRLVPTRENSKENESIAGVLLLLLPNLSHLYSKKTNKNIGKVLPCKDAIITCYPKKKGIALNTGNHGDRLFQEEVQVRVLQFSFYVSDLGRRVFMFHFFEKNIFSTW